MKTKIVLADDEQTFRETFSIVLKEEGYEVDTFDNGLDTIEEVKKTEYDIAILDIDMPGADGIKVLKEIIKCSNSQATIIFITGIIIIPVCLGCVKDNH